MSNLSLNDPSLLETRGYVNGQWISSASTFAVTNPATGETIAQVADLNVMQPLPPRRNGPRGRGRNGLAFCANGSTF